MLASLGSFAMAALFAVPMGGHGIGVSVDLQPHVYPVQSAYTPAGPYATTSGTVTSNGKVIYDTFYPSDYAALGFKSPIVTWGNGTSAIPSMYTTLLTHFASYGFTVIATTLENTGSGNEIDAAAHYLVQQDTTAGSVFEGHLDTHDVAAVGHSQGATGAIRAASADPGLITTSMTFSLPDSVFSGANPDCATAADCTPHPSQLTHPAFFISTDGPLDFFIANPVTEREYYDSAHVQAVSGIIATSGGTYADHNSVQDTTNDGGNPADELGYATAWLEYQLRGSAFAGTAFSGAHPEILSNWNWLGSAVK